MISHDITANWIRVTKHDPCPVCGKPDWCLISVDGKASICARIQSDTLAGHAGAGWLHKLENNSTRPVRPAPIQAKQSRKAGIEILSRTYTALLSDLSLADRHRENLINRGLTSEQISQYKTMPAQSERDYIIRNLQKLNHQLSGVPGFFADVYGKWHLAGYEGICIPVLDLQGKISGIQIRRDGNVGPKYVWLSSSKYANGCGSGVSIHVARPPQVNCSELWITEGPLKADIASYKLERIILAVPGVSNWTGVMPIIRELRPDRVIVAYDMDKANNPIVRLHLEDLIKYLISQNIRTFEADWDSSCKGIDDFLKGGQICRR